MWRCQGELRACPLPGVSQGKLRGVLLPPISLLPIPNAGRTILGQNRTQKGQDALPAHHPARLVRPVGLVLVSLLLLPLWGCHYAYLQSLKSKALLPPTTVVPVTSNESRLLVTGHAVASNGQPITAYTAPSSGRADERFDSTELVASNVELTPPELTGSLGVAYCAPKLLCVGGAVAMARIRGDYCFGLNVSVGIMRSLPPIGWRAELVAGLNFGPGEATVREWRDLSDFDACQDGRRHDTTYYESTNHTSRVGLHVTLNTTRPFLGLQYGCGLAAEEIFAYAFWDGSAILTANLAAISPTVFVNRTWKRLSVTAGYTFAFIASSDDWRRSGKVHQGWAQLQYAVPFHREE